MVERRRMAGRAFLQPGELFTTERPARVKTVVGSCLAIMMRAPRLGLAVIAHCLLPQAGAPLDALPRKEALRFVDTTLELILRGFAERGAAGDEMEIKLFGGADTMCKDGSGYCVGRRNIETARSVLAAHGLSVAVSGVGGRRGRSIEFDTGTGKVLVKVLPGQGPADRARAWTDDAG
jgi:chemotaxis protein CheD